MGDYEIRKNNVGLKIHVRRRIDLIVDHPAIKELVSIMPDVHENDSIIWPTLNR